VPFTTFKHNTMITAEDIQQPSDSDVLEMLQSYCFAYQDWHDELNKNRKVNKDAVSLRSEYDLGRILAFERVLELLGQINSLEEIKAHIHKSSGEKAIKEDRTSEITGDMLIGPYFLSLKLILAAESLVYAATEKMGEFEPGYYVALLSALERIIDASRSMVEPGSGGQFPEHKLQVEHHLGSLRVQIGKMADACQKDELKHALNHLAEQIETRFIRNKEMN
jgi:hypothetical protein